MFEKWFDADQEVEMIREVFFSWDNQNIDHFASFAPLSTCG